MSDSVFVYSTLGQDVAYTLWDKSGQTPERKATVTIKGGTGVIDKNLVTPYGVVTKITKEAYEILKQDRVFNKHRENGYITIRNSKVDVEIAVRDLEEKDGSVQLTEEDFGEDKAPEVAGKEKDADKPTKPKPRR